MIRMNEDNEKLLNLLISKTGLKQDVYANAKKWFKVFKTELEDFVLKSKPLITDERIRLKLLDKGDNEVNLFIGSDVLVFYLHTNIFKFSESDFVTKTSYVSENPDNGYCGIIHFYDFLADSYEFNRDNDLGYLIGRLFINKEDHFIVEGKEQLGFLYKDFMHQIINEEIIREIIYKVSIQAIEFELLTPPYRNVQLVSVQDMQALSQSSRMKTGKRLGFRFDSDGDLTAEKKI